MLSLERGADDRVPSENLREDLVEGGSLEIINPRRSNSIQPDRGEWGGGGGQRTSTRIIGQVRWRLKPGSLETVF